MTQSIEDKCKELKVNIEGWGFIKKICKSCGEEFETNYDPNYPKPDINFFPCVCGKRNFIEINQFAGEVQ